MAHLAAQYPSQVCTCIYPRAPIAHSAQQAPDKESLEGPGAEVGEGGDMETAQSVALWWEQEGSVEHSGKQGPGGQVVCILSSPRESLEQRSGREQNHSLKSSPEQEPKGGKLVSEANLIV